MGYMRHHALLVTCHNKEQAQEAHAEAERIYGQPTLMSDFSTLITPLQESAINGYWSFAVLPDGSKEGWDDSDLGDAYRDALKAWLRSKSFEDGSSPFAWAEVQYGDEDGMNYVRDSDAQREAKPLIAL